MAPETLETQPKTREQWLEDRRSGIGASEAAAALGLSAYKSPLLLWAEKTGQIEPDDLSDKLAVRLGTEMEQGVGRIFAEESGRLVSFWPQNTVARHKDASFLICTPDSIETLHNRDGVLDGVLQIKTAGRSQEQAWSPRGAGLLRTASEAPPEYQVQLAHEMEVLGLGFGTLACAIDRQYIAYFDLERNERFAQVLVTKLADFWDMVLTRREPQADWMESTREAIVRLHPKDDGSSVDLPPESSTWDEELRSAKAQMKELGQFIAERENRIRQAIGSATFGVLPNGQRYSFKHQHRSGYTVSENDIRVLLRLKR